MKAVLQPSSEYPTFGVENGGNVTGYREYCSDIKRSRNVTADHHIGQQTFATPYDEHKGP